MTDHDDELTARLRANDPAASLPPADPAAVDRLLEATMSNDLHADAPPTRGRARRPLTWLVAAAALVVIGGVGVFAATQGQDTQSPVPSAAGESSSAPTLTQLSAPGQSAYAARCMVPNSQMLATQTLAFDGVVDDITDGVVTLTPTLFYTGEETDQVQVSAPSPELQALIGAAQFEVGGRYLVSATGGRVTVCGFTGPYNPDLVALYDQAFR